MFSFLRKRTAPPPPSSAEPLSGFLPYIAPDFAEQFPALTAEQAVLVAQLYCALITPGLTHPIAQAWLHAPRDGYSIAQTYWTDPANDDKHLGWLRDFYYAVHTTDGYNGTPYPVSQTLPNSRYEGCYINYPDVDMLTGQTQELPGYSWGELYYPGIYTTLVAIKKKYDPLNIFNHAMSLGV